MLNPLWLRTFIVINETGSFTRAAEHLDLTQAAVSQHVQRLEAELGPLLLRQPRRLELTPRGRMVLAFARQQALACAQLRATLADDDPYRGTITLSTPGSIGLLLYPLLLDQQQAHPDLVIRHRFAPTHDIIHALLAGESDIGLVDRPADHPQLNARPFVQEPLCLVVPANYQGEGWADLCRLGFIDHPDGHDMAQRLLGRNYPGASLATLPIRAFTNQIGLILEPVARGLGFSVLPRCAIRAFPRPDHIRILTTPVEVTDTLWLTYRAEWPLPGRHQRLIAALQQAMCESLELPMS